MKKIIFLFAILFMVGCNDNKAIDENDISDEEKIIMMINQCIDDYNNNLIDEKEIEYNTTIKPLPINIGEIENISSLNDLNKRDSKNAITSAVYTGEYKINEYYMIFEIYNYGNNFWLDGESGFEIDIESIIVNNPEYSEAKLILDNLIKNNRLVLQHLYGVGIEKGIENSEEAGFFEVINSYKNIDEIKKEAENTFTSEFLKEYYDIAFNNEDPIYKEIDGKLYVSETDITLSEGLPYDTSRIVAVTENDNEMLVDIVIAFGEDVSNELQRITLVKTDAGYRLNNAY